MPGTSRAATEHTAMISTDGRKADRAVLISLSWFRVVRRSLGRSLMKVVMTDDKVLNGVHVPIKL